MHALGLKAEVIYQPVRQHVQLMVAYLQLILIATRGHRAYTSPELVTIFEGAGRQFFVHLEQVTQYTENKRVSRAQARHDKNPRRWAAPVPFHPPNRLVYAIWGGNSSYTRINARIQTYRIRALLHVYELGIKIKVTQGRRTTIAHGADWVCSNIPEKGYLMPWYTHPNLSRREDTTPRFVPLCRRCHTS